MPGAPQDVVAFATRAPSIRNTQPWLWQADGPRLELRADRTRQLPDVDPAGRHLTISCGAALHHASVRARALGYAGEVAVLPDPDDPDHLATLTLAPAEPDPRARAESELLARRRTDRRRFTAWPLPDEPLAELAGAVEEPGAAAVPVRETTRRLFVELLVRQATRLERTHRPPSAGDPPEVRATDGLVVLTTTDDGPRDWLATGVLLCRLWTEAMARGLTVVPLHRVVEVPDTRTTLAESVVPGLGHPQLLLRLGWEEIEQHPAPSTLRRPVDEVLRR